MPSPNDRLRRRIAMARGSEPADLVIRNAQILNTATGAIEPGDIAIGDDIVVGIHEPYKANEEIDAAGRFAVPGFIDTHLHVESSLVTPDEFERLVLPLGTTTAVCDPHEIANVLGLEGLRYMLDAAGELEMTLRVNLSSCVPASPLETSGAALEAVDLVPLLAHPQALGLAEMMNFPGVLAGDDGLMEKLTTFADGHIDGHAPLLGGLDLNGYIAAGMRTDHESTTLAEAAEKLKKGMAILLREGSIAKNVTTLAPLLDEATWPRIAFCTDDRNPLEIVEEGHIDHAIRLAIAAGAPTIACYRSASLGAAQLFRLHDRGLIAPGYRADIVLVDDLETVRVHRVVCGGKPYTPAAKGEAERSGIGRQSIRRQPANAADFAIPASAGPRPVIGAKLFSLLTDRLDIALPEQDGLQLADPANGIMKLAVLERHGLTGGMGRAFVAGLGPLDGALATSIGHDSHNLIVLGSNDIAMAGAINRLRAIEGGIVVVEGDGTLAAELPLAIAGIMSAEPFETVVNGLRALRAAALAQGCTLEEPFLHMAFLPLVVIPHLKLSDLGLVDVDRFELIE